MSRAKPRATATCQHCHVPTRNTLPRWSSERSPAACSSPTQQTATHVQLTPRRRKTRLFIDGVGVTHSQTGAPFRYRAAGIGRAMPPTRGVPMPLPCPCGTALGVVQGVAHQFRSCQASRMPCSLQGWERHKVIDMTFVSPSIAQLTLEHHNPLQDHAISRRTHIQSCRSR